MTAEMTGVQDTKMDVFAVFEQGNAIDKENLEAAQDLALGQKITFQQRINIE